MKVEKKKKQKFTTLDRLVMKIFRERSRTSRRGTCSFSSITAAALQNAHRVPAFSSSLFQLSLLLSLFRLLSQNPFLPASSICLGPRFYFYTRRCYHPPTRYSFHFPPPSTSQLPYPPPLSLSPPPPILSVSLAPPLPTLPHSVCSPPSVRYPLRDPFSFSFALFLTFSIQETVIAACIFYEASLEAYAHLYPSIRLCCIRLFANSTPRASRRTAKILPFALHPSPAPCVVINL